MYSIIVTVAFFTAVVLNDVFLQHSEIIPTHALLGLISTGIITTLWFYDLEFVGWGLLILPITAFTISLLVLYAKSYTGSTIALPVTEAPKHKNKHHRHTHDSWQEMFKHVEPKRYGDTTTHNVPRSKRILPLVHAVYSDASGNHIRANNRHDTNDTFTDSC